MILNSRYAFSGRQIVFRACIFDLHHQRGAVAFFRRAISRKPPQNSSSSVTLVLYPSIMIDRLKTAEIRLSYFDAIFVLRETSSGRDWNSNLFQP